MNKLVNKASNWLEINLDNLEYNFKGIKNKIPEGTKDGMVIKLNSHGPGGGQIGRFHEEFGAYFFS